jgi:hypothetical protein
MLPPALHGLVAVWQRQGYDCVESRDDTPDNLPRFALVPKVTVPVCYISSSGTFESDWIRLKCSSK